jgi:hypothetical protein
LLTSILHNSCGEHIRVLAWFLPGTAESLAATPRTVKLFKNSELFYAYIQIKDILYSCTYNNRPYFRSDLVCDLHLQNVRKYHVLISVFP